MIQNWMYILLMAALFIIISGYFQSFNYHNTLPITSDPITKELRSKEQRSKEQRSKDFTKTMSLSGQLPFDTDLNFEVSGQYDSDDFNKVRKLDKSIVRERYTVAGTITCHRLSNVYNISEAYLQADDWKTVIEDVLYVYSAHVDPRPDGYSIIRIFGIMKSVDIKNKQKTYYCHIYSEDNRYSFSTEAHLFTLSGHYKIKFRMVEIQCRLLRNPWSLPRMLVSITTELCAESKNLLPVRQNYRDGFNTNFTLCLDGVLKHGIDKYSQLVEWIELNRLLGVEHVFVYNFSGSSLLDPYLRYYQRKNHLTVLPWSLPIQFHKDEDEFEHDFLIVWNYAQRTMIQDCLYRNLYVARHLVYLDLDEFIIPQDDDIWTLRKMMEKARHNCSNDVGAYLARNGIFEINNMYRGDENFDSITATFTTMHARIREAPARTKYIIIPERVEYLNVHAVERYYDQSASSCVLAPSIGHVHHYKVLNKNKEKRSNLAAVKFKNVLMPKMKRVLQLEYTTSTKGS